MRCSESPFGSPRKYDAEFCERGVGLQPVFACNIYTHLRNHEGLDLPGVGNVGADAQIYHRPAAVHRGRCAVRDLRLDEMRLVLAILCTHELPPVHV